VTNPDHDTPDSDWTTIDTYATPSAAINFYLLNDTVYATGMRVLLSDSGDCIDEFQIFASSTAETGSGNEGNSILNVALSDVAGVSTLTQNGLQNTFSESSSP
jgi:hypothetical protein